MHFFLDKANIKCYNFIINNTKGQKKMICFYSYDGEGTGKECVRYASNEAYDTQEEYTTPCAYCRLKFAYDTDAYYEYWLETRQGM